jgi:outer membrane lipoprotein-sorting protein
MSHKLIRLMAALIVLTMAFAAFGCSTPSGSNANVSMNTNANGNVAAMANENTNTTAASATTASTFSTREPERYDMKMNISLEGSANNRQGSTQVEIAFARLDANRRWTLKVPSINQEISYLEKPGLKYLVIPSRNQYVEITDEAVGFPLGNLLTPSAMMERLQSKPHESLGAEPVNGRAAMKYRFTGATNTGTSAGTAQADSFIYVDQETNLPLRIDLTATTTSGATGHGIIETRDIHLNPDPTQFDVPSGYQKVTAEQLKQQVQGFIALIRAIAPYFGQQTAPPPPPSPAATNANRAATNANANRP